MPTFGWVHEDAWEGFLEGTEGVPEPGPPLPAAFHCPFCSTISISARILQDHIAAAHRISRPVLLINGREPEKETVIRKLSRMSEYAVANTTVVSVMLDGIELPIATPVELIKRLAGLRQAVVSVTLINDSEAFAAPVTSTYRITFSVAEARVLRGVEQAFAEWVVDRNLTIDAIEKFLRDKRCSGTGSDYAEGLAEYLMGVLVKERPTGQELSSPLARYRELFGSSLHKLSPHHRPLSRLICAVIRFAVNDLSGEERGTGYWDLDVAALMLKGPMAQSAQFPQPPNSARRDVCPIDHGTGRILDLAVRLSSQDRWGPILNEECRQIADADTLDVLDRQKALALWALTALRLGALEHAVDPLARLSATYPFSIWASPCLEAVNK